MSWESSIGAVKHFEGGYVNHPGDRGGETNHGITVAVARANGYTGAMRDMTWPQALEIYRREYWVKPKFDQVDQIDPAVAAELLEAGVVSGPGTPVKHMQRALVVLGQDIVPDGAIGPRTLAAIRALKPSDRADLVNLMNVLQGGHFFGLAERDPSQRAFIRGWLRRVRVVK